MEQSLSRLSSLIFCVSALGGAISPLAANAESWNVAFQPRLEVGVANYNLEFGSTTQLLPPGIALSTEKLSFRTTMPTVGIGLTTFADRFFLDLSAQRMFNGSISDSNGFIASSPDTLQAARISNESDDLSRNEYAFSLGYGITESASIYAGYKWQRGRVNNLKGTGPILTQFANGAELAGTFHEVSDYKFDYDGPFIGTTVSWEIGRGALSGRLALNAALAFLQGTLTASSGTAYAELNNGQILPYPFTIGDVYDTSGNSLGILLGVSWLGQTNVKGLSYSVGIRGYQYNFRADDQGKADINESVIQFKLGVAYAF